MNQTILLTGGSGVVGQALLEKLTDATVVCLTRQRPLEGANIIAIPGDIGEPHLGLREKQFHELARRVDWVIHSAAITDFARPPAELRHYNVEGTRNVLAFATQAKAPLIHVSTAFVHARGGHTLNHYEASKLEAEQLIRQSGAPVVIVRPSIVIGDSQTGAICKQQGIHRMMRLLLREILPVVPGSPNTFIDFVPQDSVAEAIIGLVNHKVVTGEYWLTAGAQALRFGEGLELLVEHASHLLGRTLTKPRLMNPAAFDRLIRPVFLPLFPERQQRIFEESLTFLKYMNMEETFPSSFEQLHQQLGITVLPDPRQTAQRSLEYIIGYSSERRTQAEVNIATEGVNV